MGVVLGLPDRASASHCNSTFNEDIGPTMDFPNGATQTVSGDCTGGSGCNDYFDIVLEAGDPLLLSFCPTSGSANFDTGLSVWSGPPGFTTLLVCNDDFCGLQSQLTFVAPAAGAYRVRIGGFGGSSGSYTLAYTAPVGSTIIGAGIAAEIDVMPGNPLDPIQPSSRGVIPVAILGSDEFDVADVDATTLAFGPEAAPLAHRNGPHSVDLNRDGFADLLAHFLTEEAGLVLGDEQACVTGELLDGTPFGGCDSVTTVPPERTRGPNRGCTPDTATEVELDGTCYYLDGSNGVCDPEYALAPQSVLSSIASGFVDKTYRHTQSDNCCIKHADQATEGQDWGMTGSDCNGPGPFVTGPVPGGTGCTDANQNFPRQLTLCGSQ
jgi:hypothetical protein